MLKRIDAKDLTARAQEVTLERKIQTPISFTDIRLTARAQEASLEQRDKNLDNKSLKKKATNLFEMKSTHPKS